MADLRGFQKERSMMEKRKQRDERKGCRMSTDRRIQKECQGKSKWQYPYSEPGIRGPPTAPRWKGLGINYAPSTTHRWEHEHRHEKGTMNQR
jgi:hypothetical protein